MYACVACMCDDHWPLQVLEAKASRGGDGMDGGLSPSAPLPSPALAQAAAGSSGAGPLSQRERSFDSIVLNPLLQIKSTQKVASPLSR